MGQSENKVNMGKFVNPMQLFEPFYSKTDTGETKKDWKAGCKFLSDIVDESSNSERVDEMETGRDGLTFTAWRYDITTDWKVMYNGILYNVDRITRIGNLYAKYECYHLQDEKGN